MDIWPRIRLALGIIALLAGLQTMFGWQNPAMGWIGIGIGAWLIGTAVLALLTNRKPHA